MRKLAVKIRKHAEKIRYPAGKNVETEDSAGKGQTNVEMHRKKQGTDRKAQETGRKKQETSIKKLEMVENILNLA